MSDESTPFLGPHWVVPGHAVPMWVLERDLEFVGECELPNEMMARSQCPAMLCWWATQFPCVLCVLALLCNAVSVGRSFWGILVMSPE